MHRPLDSTATGRAPLLQFRATAATRARLDAAVRRRGLTRSEFVRRAVDDALKREERTA